MTGEEGGFYSALDADSEGEEGKFYVWTHEEVAKLLGKREGRVFSEVYGFEEGGNFREEATQRKTGANIPHLAKTIEEQAKDRGVQPAELRQQLAAARRKLLGVRDDRVWPHLDDKVLTAWNGLMIGAFAYGGKHLGEPHYTAAAVRAAEFVLRTMRRDGRLLRTYRDGEAKLAAYLDDYTFLAEGLLTLHETTDEERWLDEAKSLMDTVLEQFVDRVDGGFYFTAEDHEQLLLRSKDPYDKAIPSGNGMASRVLLRLAHLTGDQTYYETARSVLDGFTGLMAQAPRGTESLVLATARYFDDGPPQTRVAGSSLRDAHPDVRVREKPVTVEAFASKTRVPPGGSLQVAVRLVIDAGWHVNSSKPLQDYLVPTTLSLNGDSPASLSKVTSPEGKRVALGFDEGPLSVYQGEAWLSARVEVAGNAREGDSELGLKVMLQACDDRSCGPQQELTLAVPITVGPDADGATRRHPAVFERLSAAAHR